MDKIYDIYLRAAADTFPEFAAAEMAEKMDILAGCLAEAELNLTAIREPEAVVWLHIIDSLYAARVLRKYADTLSGNAVADVGSGGGFPALPMAAALPEFTFCAIDSTAKKCEYIRRTAETMGLCNLSVLAARAEEYGAGVTEKPMRGQNGGRSGTKNRAKSRADSEIAARSPSGRESYSAVTARAVAGLDVLMELCVPLVAVGGIFLAMKGASADEELKNADTAAKILGAELCETVDYSLGNFADSRKILVFRKKSATPADYPRAFAKITKSPL